MERDAPADHAGECHATGGRFVLQSVVQQIDFHHFVSPRAGTMYSHWDDVHFENTSDSLGGSCIYKSMFPPRGCIGNIQVIWMTDEHARLTEGWGQHDAHPEPATAHVCICSSVK